MKQDYCNRTNDDYDCSGDRDKDYCTACPSFIMDYKFKELGKADQVDHADGNGGSAPKQYEFKEKPSQLQDLIEVKNMNFARANIFKGAWRIDYDANPVTQRKLTPEYNLNKIIWFAKRELERIKGFRKEG